MAVYPDASVIVSAYTEEVASDIAEGWLGSVAPGELMSSLWCDTEVASALAAKARAGLFTPLQRQRVLDLIRGLLRSSAISVSVEARHFTAAADLLAAARARCGRVTHCTSPSPPVQARCWSRLTIAWRKRARHSACKRSALPDHASMLLPSDAWTRPPSTVIVSPTT